MRILQALFLIFFISILGGAGWLVKKIIHLRPFGLSSAETSQCSVVVWNKTDQDISVVVRPHRVSAQYADIPAASRACIVVQAKKRTNERAELLKYIAVVYSGKKYRFYEKDVINQFFDQDSSNRYYACMIVDETDAQWQQLKERLGNKVKLDENGRYLVLSAYPKLNLPWDPQARIQAQKIKTARA